MILPEPLAIIGLVMVFAAGFIRGFTGFGFNVIAVPLLSLIMSPARVVPIVVLLQLLVSLSGFRPAWKLCERRSVAIMGGSAALATPIGVWALTCLPAAKVRLVIAFVVLLSVLLLSRGPRFRGTPDWRRMVPFGLASGLFNGLAGLPGPPVVAFYLAQPMGSMVARASMIVFFLWTSAVALVPLATFGLLNRASLFAGIISFPLAWIGSECGARVYRASPDANYRRVALGVLTVTGVFAGVRALVAILG